MANLELFTAAMYAANIPAPTKIVVNGTIQRFSTNGKPTDTSGWYVLHELGNTMFGSFGNWCTGASHSWSSHAESTLTPAMKVDLKRLQQEQTQAVAAQAQIEQDAAATDAEIVWDVAKRVAGHDSHPYLLAKAVWAHGAGLIDAIEVKKLSERLSPLMKGSLLVVPMRDANGQTRNLQFVDANGLKRPLTGGQTKGCYFTFGRVTTHIVFAEGFATGASLHECTGHAVAVTFGTANMLAVAKSMRAKYPRHTFIFAADDDWHKPGNPGKSTAIATATAVNGLVAFPIFGANRTSEATDFNDLYVLDGVDAVKASIGAASKPPLVDIVATEMPNFAKKRVLITNGKDIKPEPIQWLWFHWLPRAKLTILGGAPGDGKTTLAINMAATLTTGGLWPDGTRAEQGNVLIWSGEDSAEDTLIPRILAAGGDVSRCYFISGTMLNGERRQFNPGEDIASLEEFAKKIGGVILLIVDPVVTVVKGDSHKNAETRRDLQPLVDLASRLCCGVLAITHFSKGSAGVNPAERVIGSIAFVALPRMVLVVGNIQDADTQGQKILVRAKTNIAPIGGGFVYEISAVEPLPGILATEVEWGEFRDGEPWELLKSSSHPIEGVGASPSAVLMAEQFLQNALAGASVAWIELKDAATLAGVSKASMRRASQSLGVRKTKGLRGVSYWTLPTARDQYEHADQPEHSSAVEPVEQVEQVDQVQFNVGQSANSSSGDRQAAQPEQVPDIEQVEPVEQVESTQHLDQPGGTCMTVATENGRIEEILQGFSGTLNHPAPTGESSVEVPKPVQLVQLAQPEQGLPVEQPPIGHGPDSQPDYEDF